jgi:predicted transcriptional regulator
MSQKKSVYINVRLDSELHDELVRAVARQMVAEPSTRYTKSQLIREAIEHFLQLKQQEVPQMS